MTEFPRAKLLRLMPALLVGDIGRAEQFYASVLGFRCVELIGAPPYYAILARDDFYLELTCRDTEETVSGPGYEFALQVDDLDRELRIIQTHGLAVGEDPIEYVSGIRSMRSVRIMDPNGYRILIFERQWTSDPAYRPRVKRTVYPQAGH
jgi:predicted enzyme related to lactoylglutathione lyase